MQSSFDGGAGRKEVAAQAIPLTGQTARPGLASLYNSKEVAAALRLKSDWWVKDRARRGLIPFTRVGRNFRFTQEQFDQIVLISANESRTPKAALVGKEKIQPHGRSTVAGIHPEPAPAASSEEPALRAKPPKLRRTRGMA